MIWIRTAVAREKHAIPAHTRLLRTFRLRPDRTTWAHSLTIARCTCSSFSILYSMYCNSCVKVNLSDWQMVATTPDFHPITPSMSCCHHVCAQKKNFSDPLIMEQGEKASKSANVKGPGDDDINASRYVSACVLSTLRGPCACLSNITKNKTNFFSGRIYHSTASRTSEVR